MFKGIKPKLIVVGTHLVFPRVATLACSKLRGKSLIWRASGRLGLST